MRYPDTLLEEIRTRIDLVEWIGRYVALKRSGANFKGLCPFHQEKSPSFMVSPSKAIYKCFGCGAGGNLFTFLRDVENVSFSEAVRLAAKDAGVDLSQFADAGDSKREADGDRLYKINDEARQFFKDALHSSEGSEAREYLAERKLSSETLEEFSIGYAPQTWDALLHHLQKKGFTDEETSKAGLAKRGSEKFYDAFRHRAIFPILNLSGMTCGFSGRILATDQEPKYLNSPETAVYQKGRLLYGLLQARDAIRTEKRAIVVEGNVDLLTLHQGGIKNAVAATGTAFTETQAHLLKRFCDEALLIFDGDLAGQKAALRGLSVLINAGLIVRVAALPLGEDPDSFFKKNGREAFLAAVMPGKDVVDFSIDQFAAVNDLSVPEHTARLLTELAPLLQSVSDSVLKAALIKKITLRTGIREELVAGRKSLERRRAPSASEGNPAGRDATRREPAEVRLIELMLSASPESMQSIGSQFTAHDITDPVLAEIFERLLEKGGFNPSLLDGLSAAASEAVCSLTFEVEKRGERISEEEIQLVKKKFLKRELTPKLSDLKRRVGALPEGEEKNRLYSEYEALLKTRTK